MPFILFLILGMFLLLQMVADKGGAQSARSRYESERSEKQLDYDLWVSKVTDESLEIELQDFIYDNVKPFSKKKSDSDTVGWMSDALKAKLSDVPSEVLFWCMNQKNVLIVLMAKEGKIPESVTMCGIYCIGDNCSTEGRRLFQKQHTFIMWVDAELQKHGVEPMLFKKYSDPLQRTDYAKDLTKCHMGVYCWWSGRMYIH